MGSTHESIRYLLTQLQCRPHTITWSLPRAVTVIRGSNGKLGFRFKTYPYGEHETASVIVDVKEHCQVVGGLLQEGDRVVSICNQPVTGLGELEVKDALHNAPADAVLLKVSAMTKADPSSQVKRYLSFNSNVSAGSSSLTSEPRQAKRFAKSNSTETPPPSSPHSDLDPTGQSAAQPLAGACYNGEIHGASGSSRAYYPPPYPHPHNPNPLPHHSAHPIPPHLFPCAQYSSLPARMEDDIILPDDIVLCELNGPDSLPIVLTSHPNAPCPHPQSSTSTTTPHSSTASSNQSQAYHSSSVGSASIVAAASMMAVGADGDGDDGGGGGSNCEASGNRSLGVEVCRAPGCGLQKKCLWHHFVLTHPQFVIWDPFTKTVKMVKDEGAEIDFKYKVKKFDGPPAAEVFALVTEVTNGGMAWRQLVPGDWIRSINGTAVTTAKEAFSTDFRKLTSVRLVIQRPNGLSPKGMSRLQKKAQSMHIRLQMPVPPPPIPSQNPTPSSRAGLPSQASPSLPSVPPPFFSIPGDGAGARGWDSNHHLSSPPSAGSAVLAHSPGEHIPLANLNRHSPHLGSPSLPLSPSVLTPNPTFSTANPLLLGRCVIPRARVVVCGTHGSAVDFVRGLLAEQDGLSVDPEAPVQSFRFSLHRGGSSSGSGEDNFGNVSVLPYSVTLAKALKARECECGGGGGGVGGGTAQSMVGVELYVVNRQDFFHHCLSWLLPSATLVLLTFHVHKLLSQPEPETVTRRLAAMVHTVRAYCTPTAASNNNNSAGAANRPTTPTTTSVNCNTKSRTGVVQASNRPRLLSAASTSTPAILLYGVPSGAHDASAEEVQAIFYVTNSGNRLLEHHAHLEPRIVVPSCMAEARLQLFSACQDIVSSTMVQPRVSMVAEALSSGGSAAVRVNGRELGSLVARLNGGVEVVDPVAVQSVVQDLVSTGSLIVNGGSRASSEATEPNYLVPIRVFEALSTLLFRPAHDRHGSEYSQKWFQLLATGRATRSELQDILRCEASPLTLEMLESLGITFRFQPPSSGPKGDSGFSEDTVEFVIPFYLMDTTDGEFQGEGQRFVLTFKSYLTWRDYFDMLCNLSMLPATEEVALRGRCDSVLVHNGVRLQLHWRKNSDSDSMLLSAVRLERQRGEEVTRQSLERLFGYIVPQNIQFDLRPATAASSSRDITLSLASALVPAPFADPDETLCKQADARSEGSSEAAAASASQGSRPQTDMLLDSLPWSVLKQIAMQLTVAMTTGHDWRKVAELAGKTSVEINSYDYVKTMEVPAMTFLRDWMCTGTIQQLLDILESLERPDVMDIILNYLGDREPQP